MRAKVPAHVARRWEMARALRRDMKKLRRVFEPSYSFWVAPGETHPYKDKDIVPVTDTWRLIGGFTKDGPEVQHAAAVLLEAMRNRAEELECPCP